jgi:hypothetical protein
MHILYLQYHIFNFENKNDLIVESIELKFLLNNLSIRAYISTM